MSHDNAGCATEATQYWMDLLDGPYRESTIETVLAATETYQLVSGGRPYCTVLRPLFVDADVPAAVSRAASAVNDAIGIAADRLLDDEGFRRAVGFPAYIDPCLELDRAVKRPSIMARLDGIFDSRGTIQFIEYNAYAGGISIQFEANHLFERAPIAREVARRFPFTVGEVCEHPVEALIAETRARGRPLPPGLAVVSSSSMITQCPWASYAASRGCRVALADLDQLDVQADAVFVAGERIDVVEINPNVFMTPTPALAPLIGAIGRGIISSMFGVSQAILRSNKLVWELLSDPAHADMFDHATRRALRQHIPWTRRVRECTTTYKGDRIDLLPFLADNQHHFVLKPTGSTGADGVVLGWKCDAAHWKATLAKATKRPYVAQQAVIPRPETFPILVDGTIVVEARTPGFDPYIWNGTRVDGFAVRVGRSTHNLSDGGSIAALFVCPASTGAA